MLRALITIFVIAGLLVVDPGFLSAQDEHDHGHGHPPAELKLKRNRKKRPPSYGKFIPRMKLMCSLIEKDGRLEDVHALLDPYTKKDPDCVGCKPLFKSIARSCRPKRSKRRRKKVKEHSGNHREQEVKEVYRQREPHPGAIEYLSSIFVDIAEIEKDRDVHYQAAMKLADLLENPRGKTKGFITYTRVMASFVRPAFEEYELFLKYQERQAREKRVEGWDAAIERAEDQHEEKSAELENIFDF